MWKSILFILLLTSISVDGAHRVKRIVGGIQAEAPPRDDPVVFIHHPTKTIRVEGLQQDQRGFYSFLGIPYADPPIGKNRFVRAKLRKLMEDFEAKKYPTPCPQPSAKNEKEIVGQEDCLKLNIHTPEMPDPDTKLPVIVFLHGGGFRFGSASQYDPRHLIGQKVVFVGVQYRLGSLGIFGLGSKESPSNGALSDCVAALRWTSKYIQFFGGDPEKVTILGHGSGASLAIMLSMSKYTSPLIRGIVAMSGSALSPHAVNLSPNNSFGDVHRINRCSRENSLKIFRCLQNVPATDIIRRDSDIQLLPQNSDFIADLSGFLGFSPNVEDIDDRRGLPGILTVYPRNFSESGHFNSKIRLLIGQTKDETSRCTSLTKLPKDTLNNLQDTATDFLSSFNLTSPFDFFNQLSSTVLNVGGWSKKFLDTFIERTTDVFFSIPTVFTAEFWSNSAFSFVYSFNFISKSKLPGGEVFLPQLPLIQSQKQPEKVAHGDDLVFLFEPRDIFGSPIANFNISFSPDDEKVRQGFIDMIAQFAKMDSSEENNSTTPNLFVPFSSKTLPFIEISNTIALKENFRLCSLVNFGGLFSFAENIQCDLLKQVDGVKESVSDFGKTLSKATYLDKVAKISPVKKVLGLFSI